MNVDLFKGPTTKLAAWLLFVVRKSLQALPHPRSIIADVLGFNLSPVMALCLFDGLSKGVAGFLISIQVIGLPSGAVV